MTLELESKISDARYQNSDSIKETGATYTPKILADFVASQISQIFFKDDKSAPIKIFDPAFGDGELLFAMANRLNELGFKRLTLAGVDTNEAVLNSTIERLREQFPLAEIDLKTEDFLKLAAAKLSQGDFFTSQFEESYDIIIANPPYVRTQILGASAAKTLSEQFNLRGRVDLYYPFVLSIPEFLTPKGVCGIITSNRFMTTNAGASVREAILRKYSVSGVWDLGDTKLFDAAVLPAVMIAQKQTENTNSPPTFVCIYESKSDEPPVAIVPDPIAALQFEGIVHQPDGRKLEIRKGTLAATLNKSDVWRLASETTDKWLETVQENTWKKFSDVGKIRVGVKTTADKIFIRSNWEDVCGNEIPETLLPLLTHFEARRYKADVGSNQKRILYTHVVENKKRVSIDLEQYPNAKKYLESHRDKLESRSYVIKAGRNWFEVWVPQQPDLWAKPKLVMRDISEEPCFWLDLDGAVVNGDCYWMVAPDGEEDLLWLALGVGNSSFIEEFYDHRFNNKLYSGRRRFITQYVKEFPLPDPGLSTSQEIIELTKELYKSVSNPDLVTLEKKLNALIRKAFGVD